MRCHLVLAAALLAGCPDTKPDTGGETDTDTGVEPIVPGSETVSASWDVDMYTEYQSPTLPRFDTLGGRRQLDSMTIAVDHAAVMTIDLENGTEVPLSTDDYTAEFYYQTIVQLGVPEEDPPFFGPGSFLAVVTEDLAAADGTESSGPDFHQETVTEDIQSELYFDWVETGHFLEAMTGTEEVQLVVGGFSEMWVYWDEAYEGDGLLYAGASALRYSGTITVTYEYSPAEE